MTHSDRAYVAALPWAFIKVAATSKHAQDRESGASRVRAQQARYAKRPWEGTKSEMKRHFGSKQRARATLRRKIPRSAAAHAYREAPGVAKTVGVAGGALAAMLAKNTLTNRLKPKMHPMTIPAAIGGMMAGNIALREVAIRSRGGYRKKKKN